MAKVTYNPYSEKSRGTSIWERMNPLRYTQTMSMDRAQILADAYDEYDGYSFYRKRGYSIAKILKEIPIFIDDEQLLAGDFSGKPMGPEWFPDLAATWVAEYADKYGVEGNGKFFKFEDEAQMEQAKKIAHRFRNCGGKEMWEKYLGPEEYEFAESVGEQGAWVCNFLSEIYAEKAWNTPDLSRLVKVGCKGLIADIDAQLDKLVVLTDDDYRAHEFYLGLKLMLEGSIEYAHRYARLATEKAAEEKDPVRKAELEEMARVCMRVPEYPAETFQEALQSLLFAILMIFYDTRTYGMGFGRVDQFLYPCYKSDIDKGYIDAEYATQLLECFRCKIMGKRQFWPELMVPNLSSESHFHNCILGGVDPITGRDATNELSYLWLEAAVRCKTPHPTLSVRYHANIDPKFMDRALEVTAMGMGFPAFMGDDNSIQYLLSRGYTIEEARDYAIGGCVLHQVPGKTSSVWPIVINCGKMLEYALRNGYDTRLNKQLGPKTGNFFEMKTFEEFLDAYKAQWAHWADFAANSNRQCRIQHIETFPDIMMSAFTDDCIKRGKVTSLGGAVHDDDTQYIVPVGVQDFGNVAYVLKYHIFCDDPICSKEELMAAIDANWEGYEELQAKLEALPKYGNDIAEVDDLVDDGYRLLEDVWYNIPSAYGHFFEVAPHSLGFHAGTGAKTGALPDGRIAWTAMSDGAVSPRQGTDTNGPAAVIASAGRVDHTALYGVLFNMRFTPESLKDKEGRDKLHALIRTYLHDLGGKHIQFNVISEEIMRDAKKHPENYTDLIVRVAGYSAYWTDLTDTIHDELILRAEQEWSL